MTSIACLVLLSVGQRLSTFLLAQAYKIVMSVQCSNPKLATGEMGYLGS